MTLIADGLMMVASLVAAIYCIVLSSRLRSLKDLDHGLGAAIAGLSRQVDSMRGALDQARKVSGSSNKDLREMTARAEMAAGRLELLLATLHDAEGERPVSARPRVPRGPSMTRAGPHAAPHEPAHDAPRSGHRSGSAARATALHLVPGADPGQEEEEGLALSEAALPEAALSDEELPDPVPDLEAGPDADAAAPAAGQGSAGDEDAGAPSSPYGTGPGPDDPGPGKTAAAAPETPPETAAAADPLRDALRALLRKPS